MKWAVRAARVIVGGMGRLGGLGVVRLVGRVGLVRQVRRVGLVGVVKGNRSFGNGVMTFFLFFYKKNNTLCMR